MGIYKNRGDVYRRHRPYATEFRSKVDSTIEQLKQENPGATVQFFGASHVSEALAIAQKPEFMPAFSWDKLASHEGCTKRIDSTVTELR